MMSYKFLLDLALIILSTKLLGIISKKFNMPQVVGALLAGLVLGPSMLNLIKETEFIHTISALGVIVLMFAAGLETDIKELKKTGVASFVIAIFGVVVPLAGGFIVANVFNVGVGSNKLLQYIFIGIVLTATSVSITVETLKELGKLSTRAGNTILGAALIDDILGIIGLTLITSLADPSVQISVVLIKILMFFVLAGGVGYLCHRVFEKWVCTSSIDRRRYVLAAFVICLVLAYVAEEFFGVADITGAFIAGLIVSNTSKTKYINERFETLSYMLLSPVFFASIGLKVQLTNINSTLIAFAAVITIVAILTKIVGCGIGAKICGYENSEAFQIGSGMVSRGEVALIVASKGIAVGLMTETILAPIVISVVITTIITPVLLKVAFAKSKEKSSGKSFA
ncbi:MAG: cation:proton antiporter [Sarcina sp.]